LFSVLVVIFLRVQVPADEQVQMTKIVIGVLYAVFYLVSAFGTKNSHRLKYFFYSQKMGIDILYDVLLFFVLLIAIALCTGESRESPWLDLPWEQQRNPFMSTRWLDH
jgi:hypothetical protein